MSKGNMLLGNASGKVGDLVFARRKGEQITRVKVDPANPQTLNQQLQRMSFATATQLAAKLRHIVDHSFEGIQEGQDSVNYFVKEAVKVAKRLSLVQYNSDNNPVVLNVAAPKSFDGAWPIPARISKGSIAPNDVSVEGNSVSMNQIFAGGSITIGNLLEKNPVGCYLTFIAIAASGTKGAIYDMSNTKLADVPNFEITYARIKVVGTIPQGMTAETTITNENVQQILNSIFGDLKTNYSGSTGEVSSIINVGDYGLKMNIDLNVIAGSVITSFEGGEKTRSTQTLVMNESELQNAESNALPANISILTWLGQASTNLDPAFLDGGDY